MAPLLRALAFAINVGLAVASYTLSVGGSCLDGKTLNACANGFYLGLDGPCTQTPWQYKTNNEGKCSATSLDLPYLEVRYSVGSLAAAVRIANCAHRMASGSRPYMLLMMAEFNMTRLTRLHPWPHIPMAKDLRILRTANRSLGRNLKLVLVCINFLYLSYAYLLVWILY